MTLRAVEFYSGIGAFAQAAQSFDLKILAAFDQSEWANLTYFSNYGLNPDHSNLDSVAAAKIPEADLWWMSPPCTPFSRRGKQKDEQDNRAKSFLHLIDLIAIKKPRFILLENVEGFKESNVHKILIDKLGSLGYKINQFSLCSSLFDVPMLRPRLFVAASLDGAILSPALPDGKNPQPLDQYLFEDDSILDCSAEMLARYAAVLNIVDPTLPGSYLICFTSGYQRCRQASGSLIATGEGRARFLSPAEILGLLGFGKDYQIPPAVPFEVAYRLVGNSVDVRAITYLLSRVLALPAKSQ